MKTIGYKLIIVIIFLSGFNSLFSNIAPDTIEQLPQKELQNNTNEEVRSYYVEGLVLHNSGQYLPAEKEFLKAVELAENTAEKEILAYSYHYLGNIEGWKSNFKQSILYHKKANVLFVELDHSEYIAISTNQISFGFEALGEYVDKTDHVATLRRFLLTTPTY